MGYGFEEFDDPLGMYKTQLPPLPPPPQMPGMGQQNPFAPGAEGGFEQAPMMDQGPPPMAAPSFRPPMATPRQMANADPNAEYLKRLDQGAIGDISSIVGDIASLPGKAMNWLNTDIQMGPPGPMKLPAKNRPMQVPGAPPPPKAAAAPPMSFPDLRAQKLEGQGYTEGAPGQYVKYDKSKTQGSGFGKSWHTPSGGGTFSGSNSFSSPDINAVEQISDNDRLAAVAQSKQRVAAAQMAPQQAHPDIFQQRVKAAAMISQLPDDKFRKIVEALNALVRGNYDQNAIGLGNVPSELQPPQ